MNNVIKLVIAMSVICVMDACKTVTPTAGANASIGANASERLNNDLGSNASERLTTPTKPKFQRMTTMPEERLLRVTYKYSGMMMEEYSDFDLTRYPEENGNKLKFRHYGRECCYEVDDSLFDTARRIIDEEKLYTLDLYYKWDAGGGIILDGYKWDFGAFFENRKYISTGGSNAEPDDTGGLRRISDFLRTAAKQCVQRDEAE